jgi:predicted nucleic acid-binding protein
MTVYVLDSSAVLRYFDDEAGAARIGDILSACVVGKSRAIISAVQWGEIAGRLRTRLGADAERRALPRILPSEVEVISANAERAVHAAELRVDRKIAYADGFALDLATDSPENILVTADYGFKAADDLAKIEFLPTK